MGTFVFRLKAPRPNFALDMTAEERVVTTGTAQIEVGKMLAGFVRPRDTA
jgi:hypothetical protein